MKTGRTEWLVVSDDVAIIGHETGQFWFLDLGSGGSAVAFSQPMTGSGSGGSTAALLEGAIVLGLGSDPAQPRARSATLPSYLFSLIGAYHNARRTPGNYLRAAKRFRELDRPELASYLEKHAREETGHERLIVKDLCALGLPGERIVANLVPEGVKPLCEFFDRLSGAQNPIGCIGYSYCFEYMAAKKQRCEVEAMQALCPEGVDASRFLRTHSSLGSEVTHVQDMVELIAGLPASDRIEIVKATYDTAVMTAGLRRDGSRPDAVLWAEIGAAAGEELALAA